MRFELFSSWHKWVHRPSIGQPGIYAIAFSATNIEGKSFSFLKEIVYFGMTSSVAGLKGRLHQFENTIAGKSGHGGADRFLNNHSYEVLKKKLYVSVLPFVCDVASNKPADLMTMGEIAKSEFVCFAEYVKYWGSLPKYNNKKDSPKFSKRKNL